MHRFRLWHTLSAPGAAAAPWLTDPSSPQPHCPPHTPSTCSHPQPLLRTPCRQPGGDQVGYAEFSDKMNASKAKNLYHGWTGWGGRGLAIELTDFAMSQLAALPGQKRMREGEGA